LESGTARERAEAKRAHSRTPWEAVPLLVAGQEATAALAGAELAALPEVRTAVGAPLREAGAIRVLPAPVRPAQSEAAAAVKGEWSVVLPVWEVLQLAVPPVERLRWVGAPVRPGWQALLPVSGEQLVAAPVKAERWAAAAVRAEHLAAAPVKAEWLAPAPLVMPVTLGRLEALALLGLHRQPVQALVRPATTRPTATVRIVARPSLWRAARTSGVRTRTCLRT